MAQQNSAGPSPTSLQNPLPLRSCCSSQIPTLVDSLSLATMPDDLADDLTSMSFGSSDRSGSSTVSTLSTGSGPLDPAARRPGRPELAMSDLRFVRKIGSGDIGSVYVVELKCGGGGGAGGCTLAAKVMDRKELEGRNKEGRARAEREILEIIDHPFLPRLYGCVENERFSCLLTEFCPGGDLHVLRQRQSGRRFGEAAVRFYASEVVVALEYLHMLGIVYRDLKPENVLVRSDGHIMLTDFDLSLTGAHSSSHPQLIPDRHVTLPHPSASAAAAVGPSSCILPSCIVPAVSCFHPKRTRKKATPHSGRRGGPHQVEFVAEPVDLRSMSFVGTHEYLAPEIVSGEGHGSTVDWWTLGVFIFELLYGVTPFKGPDNELTLANIVARALEFPKDPPVSNAVKDLVSGLLVKDPARRLGATMGAAAVKRQQFFNGVNWALLRCAAPPYVPPPFSRSDSSRDASDDSGPDTPVDYY